MTPTASIRRRIVAWGAAILAIVLAVVGVLAVASVRAPADPVSELIVVPHPDDEFQLWSLIADRPDRYRVFVSLTRGEETGYCEPEILAQSLQDDLGERAPDPRPPGRWTSECAEAREASLLGYLSQMAESDPTIPGDFGTMRAEVAPTEPDVEVCRDDDGTTVCDETARTLRIWEDRHGRGAVVFFDLGDGDVLPTEVAWAVRATLADLEQSDAPPVGAILGAFADVDGPCFPYPHPDHVAVHQTLWDTDFGVGPQLGATCFFDPRQRMSAMVGDDAADASFEVAPDGTRIGAHGVHYGWLHAGTYPLATLRQDQLFMTLQSFWVRFE